MGNFKYYRPTDRITTGTWSLGVGTARTGYGLTQHIDLDPSSPLWIAGTSIGLVNNFGAPQRIDTVYIFAHNFTNAANLRLQMHTADSWATPDVDVAVTVPTAYADGFSVHLRIDVAAAVAVAASRTKQYLRIANLSANAVTVAIGEVCLFAVAERTLTRNVAYAFSQPRNRLTSRSTSKRGVATVYDYGAIERSVNATIPATDTDFDDLLALQESTHGDATPFVFTLAPVASKTRWAEPMLVRLSSPISAAAYEHPNLIPVALSLEELGRGEVLGA